MLQYTLVAVAALAATANAASLADVCTVSNVQAAVPANGTLLGINLIPSTVVASSVYNATAGMGSSGTYSYCNVTISYTHTGKNDTVVLKYAFPSPSSFQNRFYVAGGGGYSLASDATGGLEYGAVGGATDAGYNAFETSYEDAVLYGNGSINWDATHMFAYQALGEMTIVGKAITNAFYGLSSDTKTYTYFEGCSDGGREGMSQVQRWGEEYDGVIAGAPAFRFAQQQVLHVFSSLVEYTQDYYPPPCELAKIVNSTITACDSLDGRTDGVVSRTDLCKLNFNLSSIIGESYYCAAEDGSSSGPGPSKHQAPGGTSSSQPAQNGTVTARGVAVAQAIYDGLHNCRSWELSIPSTGGDLQTGLPDITPFQSSGGKLLHFHGESDPSIPAASSVHYWQSVRSIMYGNLSQDDSISALQDWYQFYLIPGAAHCGTNSLQPGPYPQNNMEIMIDWVENGVQPTRLNATVSSGTYEGETQMLCQWPTRPLWHGNSSTFDCVDDQKSIDSWTYTFPAFKLPGYAMLPIHYTIQGTADAVDHRRH
ncbi:hypothetical protein OIDMADRAFT_34253 [Oidiodendron maius Zn]|uniref:Carboxylic ester hydrolase n=1 Tax=Oidiodendron maius (strain Zn) TaxID=913774 RepID=A0A0C3D0S6_OIDMZ|nr:hypothetical protein OIDMADRAFT_34253 [Oidiodendron maius Zn]